MWDWIRQLAAAAAGEDEDYPTPWADGSVGCAFTETGTVDAEHMANPAHRPLATAESLTRRRDLLLSLIGSYTCVEEREAIRKGEQAINKLLDELGEAVELTLSPMCRSPSYTEALVMCHVACVVGPVAVAALTACLLRSAYVNVRNHCLIDRALRRARSLQPVDEHYRRLLRASSRRARHRGRNIAVALCILATLIVVGVCVPHLWISWLVDWVAAGHGLGVELTTKRYRAGPQHRDPALPVSWSRILLNVVGNGLASILGDAALHAMEQLYLLRVFGQVPLVAAFTLMHYAASLVDEEQPRGGEWATTHRHVIAARGSSWRRSSSAAAITPPWGIPPSLTESSCAPEEEVEVEEDRRAVAPPPSVLHAGDTVGRPAVELEATTREPRWSRSPPPKRVATPHVPIGRGPNPSATPLERTPGAARAAPREPSEAASAAAASPSPRGGLRRLPANISSAVKRAQSEPCRVTVHRLIAEVPS